MLSCPKCHRILIISSSIILCNNFDALAPLCTPGLFVVCNFVGAVFQLVFENRKWFTSAPASGKGDHRAACSGFSSRSIGQSGQSGSWQGVSEPTLM